MKRFLTAAALVAALAACGQKQSADTAAPTAVPGPKIITAADLSDMANAVPSTGPREGNNYKVFFLVMRQNASPAPGFKVDFWVKGKGEKVTKTTDESGLIKVEDLPFPDATHHLNAVLHYYRGKNDDAREIDYPFIESDAYRLKDTQYIPNTATTDAQ